MKHTYMYIMNDRKIHMGLRVQHSTGVDEFFSLAPAQSKIVQIAHPEGTIPFFKIWETGQALLSYAETEQKST